MNSYTLEAIATKLAAARQRATYGDVAGLLDRPAPFVMQGAPRKPLFSWIVSAETLLPTGYTPDEVDPHLQTNARVLMSAHDLESWLRVGP